MIEDITAVIHSTPTQYLLGKATDNKRFAHAAYNCILGPGSSFYLELLFVQLINDYVFFLFLGRKYRIYRPISCSGV